MRDNVSGSGEGVTPNADRSRTRVHRGRRLMQAAAVIAVMFALVYASSTPLLTAIGDQLVHSDPLERVDSMIVLSSGLDRVIEAAELYRDGYAPLIVLTREPAPAAEQFLRARGIEVESGENRRCRVLQALGVPATAIFVLEEEINSTVDEARVFTKWAIQRSIRSVIIVTSPAHTARSRLTFGHALRDRAIKVLVRPSKLAPFRSESWWHSRATLREGLLEWQKLVYYQLIELRR